MYSSKVGHADIKVAELLYWNLTVAHSQARTFRFLNKNQLYYMHDSLGLLSWFSKYLRYILSF